MVAGRGLCRVGPPSRLRLPQGRLVCVREGMCASGKACASGEAGEAPRCRCPARIRPPAVSGRDPHIPAYPRISFGGFEPDPPRRRSPYFRGVEAARPTPHRSSSGTPLLRGGFGLFCEHMLRDSPRYHAAVLGLSQFRHISRRSCLPEAASAMIPGPQRCDLRRYLRGLVRRCLPMGPPPGGAAPRTPPAVGARGRGVCRRRRPGRPARPAPG